MRIGNRRWSLVLALSTAALGCVGGVLFSNQWPFTRERISRDLAAETGCRVRIGSFRRTFFPYPGGVAENIQFDRGVPMASIRKLTIEATWVNLLTFQRQLHLLRGEGVNVTIPPHMPAPWETASSTSDTIVDRVRADGAVLNIARQDPGAEPLRFAFRHFALYDLGHARKFRFAIDLHNPEPPGEITAQGALGPWNTTRAGLTPVDGSFELDKADLGRYDGLAGLLSSRGVVKGVLDGLEVRGHAEVAGFEAGDTGHAIPMKVDYRCRVSGLNGDTTIESARASFLQTELVARGAIRGNGGGKIAAVDFDADRARIEDLIRMFSSTPRPALEGPIVFRAHTVLPPGEKRFLRRVRLDGHFDIERGRFTKQATQERVNELSARARGDGDAKDDPDGAAEVLTKLHGSVRLRDGRARFPVIVFKAPGATAQGSGVYNLITDRVRLAGKIALQATVSQTEPGIKSVLLKPLDIFFKKRKAGAVLPVTATGVYPEVSFQVSLTGK